MRFTPTATGTFVLAVTSYGPGETGALVVDARAPGAWYVDVVWPGAESASARYLLRAR